MTQQCHSSKFFQPPVENDYVVDGNDDSASMVNYANKQELRYVHEQSYVIQCDSIQQTTFFIDYKNVNNLLSA
jgi:hypothetical protein